MMKNRIVLMILLIGLSLMASESKSQSLEERMALKEKEKESLLASLEKVRLEYDDLKMEKSIVDIKSVGLPSDTYIEHSVFVIDYSAEHKQVKVTPMVSLSI